MCEVCAADPLTHSFDPITVFKQTHVFYIYEAVEAVGVGDSGAVGGGFVWSFLLRKLT